MNKYYKLTLDDSKDLSLSVKEKGLRERNYQFPSVDSLTHLNNFNNNSTKMPSSDSYLNVLSTGKSLHNIDSSHILDLSVAHNNRQPQSCVNLSQMKSIVLNKKLAKREKSNFETDQKRIFDNHLSYISKQNNVLDRLKNSLQTLQAEALLKDKSLNSNPFYPLYQASSATQVQLPRNKKMSMKYVPPLHQVPKEGQWNQSTQNVYSKSVEPSSRVVVPTEGDSKLNKDALFNSIMKQLSTKKKATTLHTKETENSQINTARNQNDQSVLSLHQQDKEEEVTKSIPPQNVQILDLTKFSDQNTARNSTLTTFQKNNTQANSPKVLNLSVLDTPSNQIHVGRGQKFQNRRGPLFHQYEDLYQNGKIGSNIKDKFNFFKKTPVGSIITISKRSLNLKDIQSPFSGSFQGGNPYFAPPEGKSASKENKQLNQIGNKQNNNILLLSPTSQFQTKREEELKNKQQASFTKLPQQTNGQVNNQYMEILKKQNDIQKQKKQMQDKKFCQMSKRMSSFFQDHDNYQIWERYVLLCREFKRFIDVLFRIEKNLNKNMTYLIRLTGTKKYLLNEIIDQQFHLIHFGVIETLENTLISENTLKTYFKADQELKTIITESYIKDLSYINGQFEVYLNNQQIVQSSKVSEIIQAEYKMIKQKEKDLIFDQYDHTGIKNLNIKKSYQFFNDYLYNIQPRRNTYKEIQEFERNYGHFQFISQIDRDMFQNLEKSYNKIRQSNKQ